MTSTYDAPSHTHVDVDSLWKIVQEHVKAEDTVHELRLRADAVGGALADVLRLSEVRTRIIAKRRRQEKVVDDTNGIAVFERSGATERVGIQIMKPSGHIVDMDRLRDKHPGIYAKPSIVRVDEKIPFVFDIEVAEWVIARRDLAAETADWAERACISSRDAYSLAEMYAVFRYHMNRRMKERRTARYQLRDWFKRYDRLPSDTGDTAVFPFESSGDEVGIRISKVSNVQPPAVRTLRALGLDDVLREFPLIGDPRLKEHQMMRVVYPTIWTEGSVLGLDPFTFDFPMYRNEKVTRKTFSGTTAGAAEAGQYCLETE